MDLRLLLTSFALILLLVASSVQARELRTTPDQQFYVNGSWIHAADLKAGDIIQTYDGRRIRITNVTDVAAGKPVQVYGLAMNKTHTYVVDGGMIARDASDPPEANSTAPRVMRSWFARLSMLLKNSFGTWTRSSKGRVRV